MIEKSNCRHGKKIYILVVKIYATTISKKHIGPKSRRREKETCERKEEERNHVIPKNHSCQGTCWIFLMMMHGMIGSRISMYLSCKHEMNVY